MPIPRGVSPAVQSSMPLAVGNRSLAEEITVEHTEQASYLLGHLTSDYDSGPAQEQQKQNSLHIDHSALCNAEREVDVTPIAPISACQGTTTSPPSTGTSSRLPVIEVTKILPQTQVIEQTPDTSRTTQVIAEQDMNDQVMNEQPGKLTAIAAITESVAEQQEVDNLQAEVTQGEHHESSDLTLQNPYQAPAAPVNIEPASSRRYEWMQIHSEPDSSAEGHTTNHITHDKSSAMSVDRSGRGEGEPSESISAADLAAAVADEIAEHCEETTTGWGSMDIGFWIADSN